MDPDQAAGHAGRVGRLGSRGSRWVWLSLLPLGAGAWTPIYAGVRARVRSWIVLGAVWSAIALTGWVLVTVSGSGDKHHKRSSNTFAGMLLLLGWVGGAATAFVIRPGFEQRAGSPLLTAYERAEGQIRDRDRARRLVRSDPKLAREMGIGRPDLPGAADAGLVDVNNAPASALSRLPGVDDALATRIVETRAQVGGFSSVEDLGTTLDLDGDLVEQLREHTVFLPR